MMKNMGKVLLVLMFWVSLSGLCLAQVNPQPVKPVVNVGGGDEASNTDNTAFDYQAVTHELEIIEDEIKNNQFTRQSLEDVAGFLTQQDIALDALIKNIDKNSKYAQEALDALGEAPVDGAVEDESIAQKREKYTTAMTGYKNKVIEANLLKTEISRLGAMVSEARSRIIIGNLVAEQNMLISPKTFVMAISETAVFLWNVATSPITWYKKLTIEERDIVYKNIWYVILILGFALALGVFLRYYIIRNWGYRHTDEQPRYGQKVLVAIVTALAYGVIPSLLIGGCLLWLMSNLTLIHSDFGVGLASLLYYSLYVMLLWALARVILAPWNGKWRLFNISDEKAVRLYFAMKLSIILICVIACLKEIAVYYEVGNAVKLLLEVVEDAFKAFVIIILTVRIFSTPKKKVLETVVEEDVATSDNGDDVDGADAAATSDNGDDDSSVSPSFKIIFFTTLFALGTFGISLFGYPELATFIFNRFLLSILMVGVFWIVRKIISDLIRLSIVYWITTFKMRKRLLSKADFVMSLLITPVLVMFLVYSLLMLWGVPGNFMLHWVSKLVFGFKVGGIEISLISIATGLLTFLISLTLVRILKSRLASNLLNRIHMDEGIKHSLVSGVGFVGFIIAVILAVVAMGVDLSNLAVIAGALSVGIGFGLQDVIKNLVSGIIILFERPFKVGDWVIIAGEEGKIKQINIRSTELETWNRSSVIIPNATLISNSLINLTHENNWQRQSIKVGVSYDSDPELVTKVLLECAKSSKKVTKVPAPYVVFKDFGSSSLDFELRYYTADIWSGWSANSDLRYEILKRFREEGINIAYPQIVIHQGSADTSIKGWQTNI